MEIVDYSYIFTKNTDTVLRQIKHACPILNKYFIKTIANINFFLYVCTQSITYFSYIHSGKNAIPK